MAHIQRLTTVDVPVEIIDKNGERNYKWERSKDSASGRAITAPYPEMLFKGKIKGRASDPGRSKRASYYRKHGWEKCMGTVKTKRVRKANAKTPKIETVETVEDVEDIEFSLRLTDFETGHVIEVINYAPDGATAIKRVQSTYPMYSVEII